MLKSAELNGKQMKIKKILRKKILIPAVSVLVLILLIIAHFIPGPYMTDEKRRQIRTQTNLKNLLALLAQYDSGKTFPKSLSSLNHEQLKLSEELFKDGFGNKWYYEPRLNSRCPFDSILVAGKTAHLAAKTDKPESHSLIFSTGYKLILQ